MPQYGLGRGLDALISRKAPQLSQNQKQPQSFGGQNGEAVFEIPVDQILTNAYQPRLDFNDENLRELADSIKEYGILQPLVATQEGTAYRLIAGERRLRAAKLLGLKTVPVVVRTSDDHGRFAMALVENIQRVDLNPVECALAYQRLREEFNFTVQQIANKVGLPRPTISNYLRVLALPKEVQQGLRDGTITFGHAKAILSIPDASEQSAFYQHLVTGKLSADRAYLQAREISKKPITKRSYHANPDIVQKEELLREYLGTRVNIEKRTGKIGEIRIQYYSPEELTAIINKIIGE